MESGDSADSSSGATVGGGAASSRGPRVSQAFLQVAAACNSRTDLRKGLCMDACSQRSPSVGLARVAHWSSRHSCTFVAGKKARVVLG
jgi:hypothetical protein